MSRAVLAAVVALALAVALGAGPGAVPASALASHVGWPPYEMLLMNKTDSDRPLDARPGHDPFGGADSAYSCDELRARPSQSCLPLFVRRGDGFVMSDLPSSHRLLGGHGSDTIHAGGTGDVLWGDYKPCCQPGSQRDRLYGGAGPDFIYASHGRNAIQAGGGTDVIHAHFGHGTIDCGAGRDVVYVHGAHRHAYRLRGCEVVSTATGQSAPKWLLRQLPWNTCARGTTYRYGACRAAGDHPESDISGLDLSGPFDAGALAGRLTLEACRSTQQLAQLAGDFFDPSYADELRGSLSATADALAALQAFVPGVPVGTAVPSAYGNCTMDAPPTDVVAHFDFQRFLAGYEPTVCKAIAGGGGIAEGYRQTAQQVVYEVTSGWQRGLQAGGLTQGQQSAVAQLVGAASELCGGGG